MIYDFLISALLCCVIGPEDSSHPLSQSDAKLARDFWRVILYVHFLVNAYLSSTGKPNVCWSPKFSSIVGSHWLLEVFPLTHTGHCDLFGFGFSTLSSEAPKYILSTLYTLTSIYIFSILFSADHFLSSHDLNVYFRVDTDRRK